MIQTVAAEHRIVSGSWKMKYSVELSNMKMHFAAAAASDGGDDVDGVHLMPWCHYHCDAHRWCCHCSFAVKPKLSIYDVNN